MEIFAPIFDPFFQENSFDKEIASFPIFILELKTLIL